MRSTFFRAEGFSLVFTNTYVKTADLGETYVNNTYVGRAFILNLGCHVRIHLRPGPGWRCIHTVASRGRRLFH